MRPRPCALSRHQYAQLHCTLLQLLPSRAKITARVFFLTFPPCSYMYANMGRFSLAGGVGTYEQLLWHYSAALGLAASSKGFFVSAYGTSTSTGILFLARPSYDSSTGWETLVVAKGLTLSGAGVPAQVSGWGGWWEAGWQDTGQHGRGWPPLLAGAIPARADAYQICMVVVEKRLPSEPRPWWRAACRVGGEAASPARLPCMQVCGEVNNKVYVVTDAGTAISSGAHGWQGRWCWVQMSSASAVPFCRVAHISLRTH